MNCKQVQELFPDYLAKTVDDAARAEMDSHFATCAPCGEEARGLLAMWTNLSRLPEHHPSRESEIRFHAMLDAFCFRIDGAEPETTHRLGLIDWLGRLWPRQPALLGAMAVLIFALGLLLGPSLDRPQRGPAVLPAGGEQALAELRQEVSSMKQLVMLSLLRQQSASERLRGVGWSYRLEQPGQEVSIALLQALDTDPSVNVRLAAVDALRQFGQDAFITKGMLDSLARQRSPMVQIELINRMVELKERDCVPVLKGLMQATETNEDVRQRAQWGLGQLS